MEFLQEGKSPAASGIRALDRPCRGLATVRVIHMRFSMLLSQAGSFPAEEF